MLELHGRAHAGQQPVAWESNVMWRYVEQTTAWIGRLSSTEWFGLMVLVLAVGFLALKGMGSRKTY
jgi:hypothetical protein